ncbi:hypothetical protein FHETE_3635 [Fusarium heterosporum]|uniref:DUF7053 domain-containing protein n=1 Tax=Fusarium heterosporum TaxID=42747 RepID=A0A8H5TMW5_FUSHE|nr:hypothetical protein FHETE_3635 [Fusarium heterosporum]
MRSQHHISITVPISNRVPPEVVLAHIQKCTPLLEHNTVVTGYTEMSPDVALVMGDPFFGKPNSSIRTFLSHERIHLAPGLTRERSWPVTCLSIPNGIRWRANANAGVTVWTEWVVRPRQDLGTPSSAGTLTEEWELYEEVTIEANKLIMPFVSRTADGVHHQIDLSGRSVLYYASNFGGLESCRTLTQGGVGLRSQDYLGRTAVQNAADAGFQFGFSFCWRLAELAPEHVKSVFNMILHRRTIQTRTQTRHFYIHLDSGDIKV